MKINWGVILKVGAILVLVSAFFVVSVIIDNQASQVTALNSDSTQVQASTSFSEDFNWFSKNYPANHVTDFVDTPQSSRWDIAVHSRDAGTWDKLDSIIAQHGIDCASPETNFHAINDYKDTVYLCNDHLMTALAASGYGLITLTPSALADFSQNNVVVKFDMSTLRTSKRDWIDILISPVNDNLVASAEPFSPDLNGLPKNGILLEMDTNQSDFKGFVINNYNDTQLPQNNSNGYESVLKPDAMRRDTFELDLTKDHIRFGMPEYNLWWIDTNMQSLSWSQGVVQFSQYSYNPAKENDPSSGCPQGQETAVNAYPYLHCGMGNTWHWDNFYISQTVQFSIIKTDKRSVLNTDSIDTVELSSTTPQNSYLRFDGLGSIQVSFDDGKSWQDATIQKGNGNANSYSFVNYWMPIPTGIKSFKIKSTPPQYLDKSIAENFSVWSF